MAQPGGVRIDPRFLPTLDVAPAEEKEKANPLASGFVSGLGDAGSMLSSAVQGVGNLAGIPALEAGGRLGAQTASNFAREQGRADLEVAPWKDGGADVLPWLGYQVSKQIPQLATYLAAGASIPATAVPGALARLGASVPRVLGGPGLRAGADFAARRAALDGGANYAKTAIGAEAAGIPFAFGSMIQEADSKPGGLQPGDAAKAALLSPLYAGLDVIQPAQLKGLLSRGLKGNIVKRIGTAAGVGAVAEMPQEAIQTAMELSFRPDIPVNDKMTHIVDAALTGGAVGGVFGGIGGLRRMKTVDPNSLSSQDIADVVDNVLIPPERRLGAPVAYTDAAGRTEIGSGAEDALRSAPIGPRDSDAQMPSAVPPMQQQIESQTIIQPKQGSLRWAKEYGQEDLSRPFRDQTDDALQGGLRAAQRRIEAGTATDEIVRIAGLLEQELQARSVNASATETGVPPVTAETAQLEPVGGAASSDAAVSATPDFQSRLAEIKRGARNQWAKKLEAADENDLIDKVHRRIFEDQDDSKGTTTLAQRLGLLDDQLNPTSLADEISARKAVQAQGAPVANLDIPGLAQAARPVDDDFRARWNADVQETGQKDEAARAIEPADEADAQLKLYRALGREGEIGDGLEALAIKYGILDDNKRLTPLAQEFAKSDPIPTETSVKAAVSQGYKGAQASMFDRGVRGFITGDELTKFSSFEDMAAYRAGEVWAEEHNSVPKGALQQYDPNAYTGRQVTEEQRRLGSPIKVTKAAIPVDQQVQQLVNEMIDRAGIRATAHEGELATLRRMARSGAAPSDVLAEIERIKSGEAAVQRADEERYYSTGHGALANAAPREPFVGETVTKGAPRTQKAPTPTERKITAEELAKANERKAFRDRLQRLVEEVEEEQAAQRETASRELNVDKDGVLTSQQVGEFDADPVLERMIGNDGRISTRNAFKYLIAAAPDGAQRALIAKMQAAAQRLSRAGYSIEIFVSGAGREGPAIMQTSNGLTIHRNTGDVDIWLNDGSMGSLAGTNYQTLAHEMLHAVTKLQRLYGAESSADTPMGAASRDLDDLFDRIMEHIIDTPMEQLPEGVQDWLAGVNNTFDDPDEIMAWGLTNPRVQAYLKSIEFAPQMSFWQKLVQTIGRLFGIEPGSKQMNALEELLDITDRLMEETPPITELHVAWRAAMREANGDQAALQSQMVTIGRRRDAERHNGIVRDAVQQVKAAAERTVRSDSLKDNIRKMAVGWMPVTHMDKHYEREMPEIGDYKDAHSNRRATASVFSQLFEEPNYAAEKQVREAPNAARMTSDIMEATAYDIDPTRPWADQTHLHGEPNVATLQKVHAEAYRKYNLLKAQKQNHVYDALRKVNEAERFAGMATGLHQLVLGDPIGASISEFGTDPVEVFRRDSSLHNPDAARRYWHDVLTKRLDLVRNEIATLRGASTDPKLSTRLSPIEGFVRDASQAVKHMEQAPYFHLGRFGEHFAAGSVRLGADNKVDPAAVDHVADELKKAGFSGARISRDLEKPNIFMRVETIEERKKLADVMLRLQREGWLNTEVEVKDGPRQSGGFMSERSHQDMQQYVTEFLSNPMFEPDDSMTDDEKAKLAEFKKRAGDELRRIWLDMLPDTAATKVLTHRSSVPGFSGDMLRSFAFRYQIGVNALANLSAAPYINDAFEKMRGRLNDAKVSGSGQDVDLINRLYTELAQREAQRGAIENESWIDTWRAFNHAFFLGMSPSYMLVNLTQMGVLLWPELAKKHGFVGAAKAIAKVTPIAFDVLKTAFDQGMKLSGKRAADAVITQSVLENAGIDKSTSEFLMGMIGSGIIDIGGSARELGRVSSGTTDKNKDTVLRYAAAAGLYSETFTRLVAALSARELHKGPKSKLEDYAKNVVRESMLEYSTWNVPRNMGKMGIAGQFTPVMMSFLQYNTQVMFKLYRELHTAFMNKAATPEEKAEARKFLAYHMTAVTALAGSLGLPFATVAAAALEKMVDLFDDDDEPYDATAAWRNFLAETFGKDVGEMAARGLPRAFGEGVDLSQRVGEQNMLPFTNLLVDRRSWKDAFQQWAPQGYGSPVSMLINILSGVDRISEGDMLGGMAEAMPNAIKGPVKAFQISDGEYKDAKGNVLPIESPGAKDLLFQLIGLNPAAKAEYSEGRGDQAARETVLTRQSKMLRSRIVTAMLDGDRDRARELIGDARRFDEDNPAFAVLPDIESSLRRRARVQAAASITRSPIGVSQKDLEGQMLTSYANVEYNAQ